MCFKNVYFLLAVKVFCVSESLKCHSQSDLGKHLLTWPLISQRKGRVASQDECFCGTAGAKGKALGGRGEEPIPSSEYCFWIISTFLHEFGTNPCTSLHLIVHKALSRISSLKLRLPGNSVDKCSTGWVSHLTLLSFLLCWMELWISLTIAKVKGGHW